MARPSSRNGTSALGAARRFRIPRDIGSPAPLASLFLMKPITSFPNFFCSLFVYTFCESIVHQYSTGQKEATGKVCIKLSDESDEKSHL